MELNGRSQSGAEGDRLRVLRQRPARYVAPPVSGGLKHVEHSWKKGDAAAEVEAMNDPFRQLCMKVVESLLVPSLMTTSTADEYVRFWREHWDALVDGLDGLNLIRRQRGGEESEELDSDVKKDLREIAAKVAGPDASDEADFALATFGRALRLVGRFHVLGEPQNVTDDQLRGLEFRTACAIYFVGMTSIFLLEMPGVRPAPDVLLMVFEFLRKGALDAYSAARQAYELRRAPSDSEADSAGADAWDEEDALLAEASGDAADVALSRASG